MDFNKLLKKYGLSQAQFSRDFNVPLRTVHFWAERPETMRAYLLNFIEIALEYKCGNKNNK